MMAIRPDIAEGRLAASGETRPLDPLPTPALDRLARLAARLLSTPVGRVALLDGDRLRITGQVGLAEETLPCDGSFCAQVILERRLLVVPDTQADPRFARHPLVTATRPIRFYAGTPLLTEEGAAVGTLCVMDHLPRTPSADELETLRLLGEQVVAQLELGLLRARAAEQAEAQRRADEALGTWFAASEDLLCVCDLEERIVQANPAWQRLLGHPAAELVGRPLHQVFYPEDREASATELRKLSCGARMALFESRILDGKGEVRWFRWSAVASPSEGRIHALGRDITEQRAYEERLRVHYDHSSDGYLVFDHSGIIDCNRATIQMLRCADKAEVLSLHPAQLSPEFQPDGRRSLEKSIEMDRTAQERGYHRFEWIHRKADGEDFPVEVVLTPVSLGGKPALLTVWHDLTERKAVERLKNEFVSIVSHELRTPLTAIRGALRLIEGGVTGTLPLEALELVQLASANSDRLVRLINDILDIEKIEAGRLVLHLHELEPAPLVRATIDGLRAVAEQAGVRLVAEVNAVGPLWGNGDRLIQVLTNLVSNGIKFSPAGGEVRLTVCRTPDERLRFAVSDRGPGIAAEDIPKLFAKFQQLDSSNARKKGGTGLGLAISKAIVEQHKGRIGVESTPGEGTTFWFELPLGGGPSPSESTSGEAHLPDP